MFDDEYQHEFSILDLNKMFSLMFDDEYQYDFSILDPNRGVFSLKLKRASWANLIKPLVLCTP